MIRSTKSILSTFLLLTAACPVFTQAQDRNPFSTPKVMTVLSETKKEKVVVDIKTLDLVVDWLDENIAIGSAIDRAVVLQRKIEVMQNGSEAGVNRISHSKQQLDELRTSIRERDAKLNHIPMATTFDLERWHQFKEELQVRRTKFRVQRAEMQQQIDSLKNENELLRNELERLKNNK